MLILVVLINQLSVVEIRFKTGYRLSLAFEKQCYTVHVTLYKAYHYVHTPETCLVSYSAYLSICVAGCQRAFLSLCSYLFVNLSSMLTYEWPHHYTSMHQRHRSVEINGHKFCPSYRPGHCSVAKSLTPKQMHEFIYSDISAHFQLIFNMKMIKINKFDYSLSKK